MKGFNALGRKIMRSTLNLSSRSAFARTNKMAIASMGNLGTTSQVVPKSNIKVPFLTRARNRRL